MKFLLFLGTIIIALSSPTQNHTSTYTVGETFQDDDRFSFMSNKSSAIFHMVREGCFADPPQMTRSSNRNWGNIPKKLDPIVCRSAGGGLRVPRTL